MSQADELARQGDAAVKAAPAGWREKWVSPAAAGLPEKIKIPAGSRVRLIEARGGRGQAGWLVTPPETAAVTTAEAAAAAAAGGHLSLFIAMAEKAIPPTAGEYGAILRSAPHGVTRGACYVPVGLWCVSAHPEKGLRFSAVATAEEAMAAVEAAGLDPEPQEKGYKGFVSAAFSRGHEDRVAEIVAARSEWIARRDAAAAAKAAEAGK